MAWNSAAIAVASLALLVAGLNVPMLGTVGLLAGVVALLVAASLGLGLLISIVSAAFPGIFVYLILWVLIPEQPASALEHASPVTATPPQQP